MYNTYCNIPHKDPYAYGTWCSYRNCMFCFLLHQISSMGWDVRISMILSQNLAALAALGRSLTGIYITRYKNLEGYGGCWCGSGFFNEITGHCYTTFKRCFYFEQTKHIKCFRPVAFRGITTISTSIFFWSKYIQWIFMNSARNPCDCQNMYSKHFQKKKWR